MSLSSYGLKATLPEFDGGGTPNPEHAASQTRLTADCSVDRRAQVLHHLGAALDLEVHVRIELFRGRPDDVLAGGFGLFLCLGRAHRLDDFGVGLLQYGRGHAGGGENAW